MKLDPTQHIVSALDRWSQVALEQDWVAQWVPGAIFPTEMVFFLARCEQAGITTIFESGRQDGISTGILGEYARRMNGRVISIDTECDAARAAACRTRLSGEPRLTLVKGNAARLLGPLISSESTEPAAVLVDGPKHYYALSLLLASAGYSQVKLLAMHNLNPDLAIRGYFQRLGDGPHFYEEISDVPGSAWRQLQADEIATCHEQDNRFLGTCCLGVLSINTHRRWKYWLRMSPRFTRRQPLRYYARWRLPDAA